MKRLCSLLLFIGVNAHAQKYLPANFDSMPKLMSFEQLMYLPDSKRAEYVKDVRLALAELEKSLAKTPRKSAEFDFWRERAAGLIARFSSIALPAANAADDCPRGYTRDGLQCLREIGWGGSKCAPGEIETLTDSGRRFCEAPRRRTRPGPDSATVFAPVDPRTLQKFETGDVSGGPMGSRSFTPPAAQAADVSAQTPPQIKLPEKCKLRTEAKDYHKDAAAFYSGVQPPNPNLRNCIMGGMFSTYNNGQIRAGNCKKVTEFPPGNAAEGAEKLKCTGKKAMCNPMLYCGPKKGEAHCLAVTQDFTKSCEAKASDSCDPFKGDTMVPGAKENWEEFKHDVENLCLGTKAGNRFAEYFCEECKALEARMKKIQQKYAAYTANMPQAVANPPREGGPGTAVRERAPGGR